MREFDLTGIAQVGEHDLILEYQHCSWLGAPILPLLTLCGTFAIEDGKIARAAERDTAAMSWTDLGYPHFSGAAIYAQSFDWQPVPAGSRVLLRCADVRDHERIAREGAVNSGSFKVTRNPKIYMFGVGSGLGKVPQQERNPFLNLKEMREGNWDGSLGWVNVGGAKQQMSSMLLDTGLTNMMIEFPELAGISDVEQGTDISVHLLGGRLAYEFKVGDFTNPVTPRRVSWMKYSAGPLINTGLRALALYDYLYDADGGCLGLWPRKKQP